MLGSDFECRKLKVYDLSAVWDLFDKHFYTIWPQTSSDELSENAKHNRRCRLERYLKTNISIGIFQRQTDILAGAVLSDFAKGVTNVYSSQKDGAGIDYFDIMKMMQEVENGVKLDLQKDAKSFYIGLLCVSGDFRKMGIGSELIRSCDQVASETNCKYIYVIAMTSPPQRIFENLNYDSISEVEYAAFVNPITGAKPFVDSEISKQAVKLMYKSVPP